MSGQVSPISARSAAVTQKRYLITVGQQTGEFDIAWSEHELADDLFPPASWTRLRADHLFMAWKIVI